MIAVEIESVERTKNGVTHKVQIHCDVIDPDSGEIVAEEGETLDDRSPRARHAFTLVVNNPNSYSYRLGHDATHIEEVE